MCESLHPHGQMTQTQSCFCLAKENGAKNTTIKMIFILRNYSFWHPQNNIFCFSQGGLALIKTSTGLENDLSEIMPVCVAYGS